MEYLHNKFGKNHLMTDSHSPRIKNEYTLSDTHELNSIGFSNHFRVGDHFEPHHKL